MRVGLKGEKGLETEAGIGRGGGGDRNFVGDCPLKSNAFHANHLCAMCVVLASVWFY